MVKKRFPYGVFRLSVLLGLVSLFLIGHPRAGAGAELTYLLAGKNDTWSDQVVTTTAQTVIELDVDLESEAPILKVTFSGGRLSFSVDSSDKTSQVAFAVSLDNVVMAEYLDFDSAIGFRNTYPMLATVLENVSAGPHTIKVTVYKTPNQGEEGVLTYTTTNTYKAYLVVERPGLQGDVNGDLKIGMEEAINALQVVSGTR
ncbi:MAG: hypothetical protein SWE60_15100 [Thermodesulfobacteriota bacterium]|nr:hypothetical protein [Thermodesulfobacteriota bacterium]